MGPVAAYGLENAGVNRVFFVMSSSLNWLPLSLFRCQKAPFMIGLWVDCLDFSETGITFLAPGYCPWNEL